MTKTEIEAAAKLLRDAGFVIVRPGWTETMSTAGVAALEFSQHLSGPLAVARIYASVLSVATLEALDSLSELEQDRQTAYDAIWREVPDDAKIE